MKIVNIGLDPGILNPTSAAAFRARHYGEIVEEYRHIVPDKKDSIVELSDSVTLYGVGGTFKIIRLCKIAFLLRSFIRQGTCDVIASGDPYFLSVVAYVIAKIYSVGSEIHILGIEKLTWFRHRVARFIVKRAGSVRVNSTRLRDRVAREFNVPWKEILFVPIYVPVESLGLGTTTLGSEEQAHRDALKKEFQVHYGTRFNFLFVGRLVSVKNVSMQVQAMQKVAETFPDACLHIVGDGPDTEALKKETEALGLEKNIVFHGRKSGISLGVFYTECDCFLLTSNAEGWPMVVFEAITAGLPVIMTDVGCAGEMIRHEENGLIVPVGDVSALAHEMKRILSDARLRGTLVAAAQKHLENYWTFDQILVGYRNSWEKALVNKL